MTRRYFLRLSTYYSLLLPPGLSLFPRLSCALDDRTQSKLGKGQFKTLATLIRDLFPHHGIPKKLYDAAAQAIAGQILQVNEQRIMVTEGLDNLNNEGQWSDLNEAQRVAVLKGLQTTPFFNYVRSSAARIIYRDPGVWKLIGYGGSSIEYGGYLHRGFNDINWLPESTR